MAIITINPKRKNIKYQNEFEYFTRLSMLSNTSLQVVRVDRNPTSISGIVASRDHDSRRPRVGVARGTTTPLALVSSTQSIEWRSLVVGCHMLIE